MIVGWTVEESESADYSSQLISQACLAHGVTKQQLTLHSDNGGPMKGATMLSTLQVLGEIPSFSRPSVSDDNPYSESLFKTLKYRPSYPDGSFSSKKEAQDWVEHFVHWYNTEHMHSGIKFVTPVSRHKGNDLEILKKRQATYELAKLNNPARWSGRTRNWNHITEVLLNPGKDNKKARLEMLSIQAA
jgi:transposase InsO family protein